MEPYKIDVLIQDGVTYRVDYFRDIDCDFPWKESDCHGIVSEHTRRSKKPGEKVLFSKSGDYRYYDLQASQAKALAEGWGINQDTKGFTKKQIAALAVEQDFQRLYAWCNDKWFWAGIVITEVLDEVDGLSASLWGLESDCIDTASIYPDLIGEIVYQRNNGVTP